MRFNLYVPAKDTLGIMLGSAIVGRPIADGQVLIDYEGNKHDVTNLRTYADRVFSAAGRQSVGYPTVARSIVNDEWLSLVGSFDTETQVIRVTNDAQLAKWLGVTEVPGSELARSSLVSETPEMAGVR